MLRKHALQGALGILIALLLAACSSPQPTVPGRTPFAFVTASPQPTSTLAPPTAIPPTTTPTPTSTPPFTRTPAFSITGTALPPQSTATPTSIRRAICSTQPEGVFRAVYHRVPDLLVDLGCIVAEDQRTEREWPVTIRYQPMEHGHLLGLSNVGWFNRPVVYALFEDGTYIRYDDTYSAGADRPSGGPAPPEGFYRPEENLGKVWRLIPGLIEWLGFATEPERLIYTEMQMYESGEMVYVPSVEVVFVLLRDIPNRWRVIDLTSLTPTPTSSPIPGD